MLNFTERIRSLKLETNTESVVGFQVPMFFLERVVMNSSSLQKN